MTTQERLVRAYKLADASNLSGVLRTFTEDADHVIGKHNRKGSDERYLVLLWADIIRNILCHPLTTETMDAYHRAGELTITHEEVSHDEQE